METETVVETGAKTVAETDAETVGAENEKYYENIRNIRTKVLSELKDMIGVYENVYENDFERTYTSNPIGESNM
jgi:hypothetical protein